MPSVLESLREAVVEALLTQHPITGQPLGYLEYLDLPEALRGGDEMPFVDARFTPRLLAWLGYTEADWTYNQGYAGADKQRNRPDYMLRLNGVTTFVVEDKNSTHPFGKEDVDQLQRYTAGTQGYALWTNARTVLALHFFPGGGYRILAEVRLDELDLDLDSQDNAAALLKLLFERRRFDSMPGILDRICLPEAQWLAAVRPLDSADSQRAFIRETGALLGDLTVAARAQVDMAERDVVAARSDLSMTSTAMTQIVEQLVLNVDPQLRDPVRDQLSALLANPLNVDEIGLDALKPPGLPPIAAQTWDKQISTVLGLIADFREREFSRRQSRHVHGSFQVWKESFKIIEGKASSEASRRNAYAEQVAYTFFVRLLLARILEDKGVSKRLISDGGLDAWRRVAQPARLEAVDAEAALHGRALLEVLFQSISRFYQHFFNQPVFDWYTPDDYLLAVALERLSTFSFASINRDLLGFAYEAYVTRAFRNAKGNFLTSPAIVDYILDEAGYEGREIIGRKLLDPASGSGSFLVQAAQRLRAALAAAAGTLQLPVDERREWLATQYISQLQKCLVGMEINPFSCYLAELNLFLQALDDLIFLWDRHGVPATIEEFAIFNTDSLVLADAVMQNGPQLGGDYEGLHRDHAREVKLAAEQYFDFVVMNPPYINRAIEQGSRDLTAIPFYNVIFGAGDTNYYQAFLRLANHFVRAGGVVAFVVPLNLFGDKSANGLRRWVAAPLAGAPPSGLVAEWVINSLTRYYSRTTLFDDVLQGVCVASWQRQAALGDYMLHVAGGSTIAEARQNRVALAASRVVATDPVSTGAPVNALWHDAWAVVPSPEVLDTWERLRGACSTDLLGWSAGRLIFRQGDINITRTKPLRAVADGGQVSEFVAPIPTVGGKDVADFGPFAPSGQVDASANVGAMALTEAKRRQAETERADRLERLLELSVPEFVCVLKDIVGLEPARPIRGALYSRGGTQPLVAFEHTLQTIFPVTPASNDVVAACFGILMSSVSNFILALFSTNAHVTTNELQRLPLPTLRDSQVQSIAAAAKHVQAEGERFRSYHDSVRATGRYGALVPSAVAVVDAAQYDVEPVGTAVLRGHLELSGDSSRKVSWLADQELLVPADGVGAQFREAFHLLAALDETRYSETVAKLPTPQTAAHFLAAYERARHELSIREDAFFQALANLDREVLAVYGVVDLPTMRLIGNGMPWASTMKEFASEITRRL